MDIIFPINVPMQRFFVALGTASLLAFIGMIVTTQKIIEKIRLSYQGKHLPCSLPSVAVNFHLKYACYLFTDSPIIRTTRNKKFYEFRLELRVNATRYLGIQLKKIIS